MNTDSINANNPIWQKANQPKIWLLFLAGVMTLCSLALCAVSGGLLMWQRQSSPGDNSEVTLATVEQNQLDSSSTPRPTPTVRPSPVAKSRLGLSSMPLPVEPEPVIVCPEASLITATLSLSPTLSPISFATRQDDDGWPLDPAVQFVTSVDRVLATFTYTGMRDGSNWERVWLLGDEELSRGSGLWDAGPSGKLTIQAALEEGGFKPGEYKLEIYGEGQLLAEGKFLVVDQETERPIQVAYTSWDGEQHQLNLLDLATNQSELLLESARSPAWSSHAKGLLFFSDTGLAEGAPGLWVYNKETGESAQISEEISFQSIVWSPHHAHVASTLTEEDGSRLVLWDITENQVFNGPAGADPAWSPDGLRLAYRHCDEEGWGLSVVPVVGDHFDLASRQSLTSGDDSQPAWSWDGQRLAFVRQEDDNQEIYTIGVDGSDLTRLTDNAAAEVSPAWTPDGRLVFRSFRDGQWGLYLINADGSGERQLVSDDSPPEWQPDRLAVSTNVLVSEPPPPKPQIQIPAGHGLLIVSNQANNDEMTFTIDNVEHKIGPYQTRSLPLRPGRYTFTASWPAKHSRTGFAEIVAGQVAYPVVER